MQLYQKNVTMKNIRYVLLSSLVLLASCVNRTYDGTGYAQPVYIAPGVGLGTIIAVVISWSRNKSVLWAIIHGILGWLYVIYAVLFARK